MKTKNKKPIIVFFALGFFLIISSILLRYFFGNIEGPYYSYEDGPFHTVTTITSFLGVFLCIAAIGITIVSNVSNNGLSLNKDPRLDHKGVDKTKKFATGEFVSAHKCDNGNYIVRFEYTNQDEEIQGESEPIYTYIDAKYFQKVKRFTVCFDETGGYIYDEPRPGMIPELANAPLVPNEKVKPIGTKEDAKSKQVKIKKQEEELVRLFCSYCDCAIKPNSTKCPHCSAPIRKSK